MIKKSSYNMKFQIWSVVLLMLFCAAIYIQKPPISIGPKVFKNTIQFKSEFKEKTEVSVCIFSADKEVKKNNYIVSNTVLKIDLKDLEFGEKYTVKVYNNKQDLLFTDEISKTLKYN